MPKKRKHKIRLPDKIIALPNADKKFHESWNDKREKLNFPHPYRACILGRCGCGKTTVVKNILLRAKPCFKELVVIHCDSEYTKEYDDIENKEILDEIPAPEDWEGEVKTLVVLDDLEYKTMKKEQKHNLDRLFGYCSTHKNISVLLCAQDGFNVPPSVRRCCDLCILWKSNDLDTMANIARKSGLNKKDFVSLFSLLTEYRDSLWLDMTGGGKSPYPIRKYGFELITKGEN